MQNGIVLTPEKDFEGSYTCLLEVCGRDSLSGEMESCRMKQQG